MHQEASQDRPEPLRPDLLWARTFSVASVDARPGLFLDRDGVIVEDAGYLSRPEDLRLIEGAAQSITLARQLGYAVVVVTNQSGIGRGLFGWREYEAVENRLMEMLARHGTAVDMILACPFHPDGVPPYDKEHPWRKPNPGMLWAAARQLNVDLARSILVGDKASDVEAARAAGLRSAIHVLSGHGHLERPAAMALATGEFDVFTEDSIASCCLGPGLQRQADPGQADSGQADPDR